MKKIFSFILVALFSASAWADTRTIYCKMAHSWWYEGNAVVGCYAFGDGNNTWPGVRMSRVSNDPESEDYTLWTIDLDTKYTTVVFTRLNPNDNGDLYWNTKSGDLVLPAHRNLFTISSTEKKTGDNVVEGAWTGKDAKYYIVGSMAAWNATDALFSTTDNYTFNLDAGTHKFKVVDLSGDWNGLAAMTDTLGGLYPDADGNVCFKLAAAGSVTLTYTNTPEYSFYLSGTITTPTVALVGSILELGSDEANWNGANALVLNNVALDKKSASVSWTPSDYYYEFKVIFDGAEWLSKDGAGDTQYYINRGNKFATGLASGKKNLVITPDVVGKAYTFTWTYATGRLDVTFPDKGGETAIDNTEVSEKAVKRIVNGQLVIEREGKMYNALGAEVK